MPNKAIITIEGGDDDDENFTLSVHFDPPYLKGKPTVVQKIVMDITQYLAGKNAFELGFLEVDGVRDEL